MSLSCSPFVVLNQLTNQPRQTYTRMGKEYRIFFEAAVGFDVWTEISKYKKNFSADRLGEEKRTDNYIDINCADFGLKFRGGNNGLLELKTKESGKKSE